MDSDPLAAFQVEVVRGQREERLVAGGEVRVGAPCEQGHQRLVAHSPEWPVDVLEIDRPRQRVQPINSLELRAQAIARAVVVGK
jgi:hypothetical protein